MKQIKEYYLIIFILRMIFFNMKCFINESHGEIGKNISEIKIGLGWAFCLSSVIY